MTPILKSAARGHLDIVKYLERRGANMEAVDSVRWMKFDDICDCRVDGMY